MEAYLRTISSSSMLFSVNRETWKIIPVNCAHNPPPPYCPTYMLSIKHKHTFLSIYYEQQDSNQQILKLQAKSFFLSALMWLTVENSACSFTIL